MKKSFMILTALVYALVVPVLTGSVAAAQTSQIFFTSVSGNWHDPVDNVPGNQRGQPIITNAVPTSSLSWGATSGAQSGYDFTRKIPSLQTLPPAPTPFFPLGTFTHRNFTIADPSLTTVQLDVVLLLNVDGVQTGPLTFTFAFNHVETPNNPTPPALCPYPTPSGEGCADRVTFVSSPRPTTFRVRGVDYTLSMSFVNNGSPVSEFITREGRVNTADLVGQFTVAAPPTGPELVVTKTGPATMSSGQWGNFAIDVRNSGQTDAWNVTLRDLLPRGATGGMCNQTPEILSAQVFTADGTTAVPGKGPLIPGSGYSMNYSAAPNCRLDMTMLNAAGTIGPSQRLIVRYRTQLDANTQNGVTLTNVAGAIQWFDAQSGSPNRTASNRTLTNGTPGTPDHEDAFSVTLTVTGPVATEPELVVTKSGPATMTLGQFGNFAIDVRNPGPAAAWNTTIRDLLPDGTTGGMCDLTPEILSVQVFASDGSTPIAGKTALSAGSGYSLSYSAAPNCRLEMTMSTAAGTIGPNERLIIRYRTQLDANTQNGVTLTNVAGAIQWFDADSSNSNRKSSTRILTNGTPGILDHEDAFTVTATVTGPPAPTEPVLVVTKAGPATMTLGQFGNFAIDVRNAGPVVAWNTAIRDLLPDGPTGGMCDLTPEILSVQVFASDGSTPIAGKTALSAGSGYSLSYSAAPNCRLDLTMLTAAGTIGPNERLIIRYKTQLDANTQIGVTLTNVAGAIQWFDADSSNPNRKSSTRTLTNGTPGILDHEDAFTVTVTGPPAATTDPVLVVTKSGPASMTLGQWGDFAIDVRNTGPVAAWNTIIRDLLPDGTPGGMCDLTPEILSVQVFASDGVTPISGKTALYPVSGYSLTYSAAPNCQLEIVVQTSVGTIGPNERLIIRYRTQLDANTQNGVTLTNVAGAVQWFDADSSNPNRKSSTRTLTNGTPAIVDHEDDHTVTVALSGASAATFRFHKISTDLTVDPNVLLPNETLRYTITVKNIGNLDAVNVVLRDAVPANTTYVANSTTLNGTAVADTGGLSPLASGMLINSPGNPTPGSMSADASPSTANVAIITFDVVINASVANGTMISNQGFVSGPANGIVDFPSDDPDTPTPNDPTIDIVGSVPGPGVPGPGTLSGSAWHDADFNAVRDSRERVLSGWTVELYRDNQLSQSASTDANGDYRITGVEANNQTTVRYELRFRAPGAGVNTASLGRGASEFTNGIQRITNIVVTAGANLQGLNLPIHPNGVIYNSMLRTPVAGVTLNLLDARSATPLPAACFDDAAQQGQITLGNGYYKFDINFSDPACPSGGDYLIGITAPQGTNYVTGYSQIIPPASSALSSAFSVPACPSSGADAIPGTALYCEVQPSEFPPTSSVPARTAGTSYYVHLMLDSRQMPGTSQIFNNHIALDPLITGSLAISKTTPLINVSRGQLVPYVITVKNPASLMLTGVSIVDRLPLGFSYVQGSALLDDVPAEPSVAAGVLSWNGLTIAGTETRTLKLLVAVGAGVTGGEYVNRAQVMGATTGGAISVEATATVRLMPDITLDCTDVTGKVFNDANRNGLQDNGEEGLGGVRVVTPPGLQATTDKYGRYHISCAITPNESRGSNFVVKLDDRTLPSGFRMSTDLLQIKRATRGKTLQLNFAASVHRVVGIDFSDAVFEPGKTEIRDQWRPRLEMLLQELAKEPSVLRLSYVADTEDAGLVERRVAAIKRQLTEAWGTANRSYTLTIEPEVFWRRGGPPKKR